MVSPFLPRDIYPNSYLHLELSPQLPQLSYESLNINEDYFSNFMYNLNLYYKNYFNKNNDDSPISIREQLDILKIETKYAPEYFSIYCDDKNYFKDAEQIYNSSKDDINNEDCVICFDCKANINNPNCGHTVICNNCIFSYKQRYPEYMIPCPICRTKATTVQREYSLKDKIEFYKKYELNKKYNSYKKYILTLIHDKNLDNKINIVPDSESYDFKDKKLKKIQNKLELKYLTNYMAIYVSDSDESYFELYDNNKFLDFNNNIFVLKSKNYKNLLKDILKEKFSQKKLNDYMKNIHIEKHMNKIKKISERRSYK